MAGLINASNFQVPSSSLAARSTFGCTPDGAFVAVGNAQGSVYLYDTTKGERVATVSPGKVSSTYTVLQICNTVSEGSVTRSDIDRHIVLLSLLRKHKLYVMHEWT